MKRKLSDIGIKDALGTIINKIFFKGGLKLKNNPETKKNARNLSSLLTYIQKILRIME